MRSSSTWGAIVSAAGIVVVGGGWLGLTVLDASTPDPQPPPPTMAGLDGADVPEDGDPSLGWALDANGVDAEETTAVAERYRELAPEGVAPGSTFEDDQRLAVGAVSLCQELADGASAEKVRVLLVADGLSDDEADGVGRYLVDDFCPSTEVEPAPTSSTPEGIGGGG